MSSVSQLKRCVHKTPAPIPHLDLLATHYENQAMGLYGVIEDHEAVSLRAHAGSLRAVLACIDAVAQSSKGDPACHESAYVKGGTVPCGTEVNGAPRFCEAHEAIMWRAVGGLLHLQGGVRNAHERLIARERTLVNELRRVRRAADALNEVGADVVSVPASVTLRPETTASRIVALLRARGPLSTAEVASEVGSDYCHVSKSLVRLARARTIERIAFGVYGAKA